MNKNELLAWVRIKIADTQKSIRCRDEAVKTFRAGTDTEWAAVAEMHPSTSGKPMNKKARMNSADSNHRIAATLRKDLEMLQAIYEIIKNVP